MQLLAGERPAARLALRSRAALRLLPPPRRPACSLSFSSATVGRRPPESRPSTPWPASAPGSTSVSEDARCRDSPGVRPAGLLRHRPAPRPEPGRLAATGLPIGCMPNPQRLPAAGRSRLPASSASAPLLLSSSASPSELSEEGRAVGWPRSMAGSTQGCSSTCWRGRPVHSVSKPGSGCRAGACALWPTGMAPTACRHRGSPSSCSSQHALFSAQCQPHAEGLVPQHNPTSSSVILLAGSACSRASTRSLHCWPTCRFVSSGQQVVGCNPGPRPQGLARQPPSLRLIRPSQQVAPPLPAAAVARRAARPAEWPAGWAPQRGCAPLAPQTASRPATTRLHIGGGG